MTRKRNLSEDELALWHEVMRDVRRPARRRKAPAKPAASTPEKKSARLDAGESAPPAPRASPQQPPRRVASGLSGLDGATAERLRRGKINPDATLDLHGLTQSQAHSRLVAFVRRSHERGARCVLIVTGKGSPRREDGDAGLRGFVMPQRSKAGVLREHVPIWLETAETRSLVGGIQPAHVRHGGAGAFYVYLKRKKPARS